MIRSQNTAFFKRILFFNDSFQSLHCKNDKKKNNIMWKVDVKKKLTVTWRGPTNWINKSKCLISLPSKTIVQIITSSRGELQTWLLFEFGLTNNLFIVYPLQTHIWYGIHVIIWYNVQFNTIFIKIHVIIWSIFYSQ
jgi:hypothetical protein